MVEAEQGVRLVATAKETILWRIRHATRDVPEAERPEDVSVEREYRKEDGAERAEIVARFAERTAEYEADVHRVGHDELPQAIEEALTRRGVRRLVIPPYLPREWIPEGIETLHDAARSRLTNQELDESDGVLTGCALGIAQTGTIVLDAGRAQGRRALTLLPDYHLCVVRERQIVGLVPEAFVSLERAVEDEGRAVTFISGPSATSDIELDRVEGVHGPRTLEVLIVG
jgi:L-lactate dehydrogenase complex protein LldG